MLFSFTLTHTPEARSRPLNAQRILGSRSLIQHLWPRKKSQMAIW